MTTGRVKRTREKENFVGFVTFETGDREVTERKDTGKVTTCKCRGLLWAGIDKD